MDVSIAIVVRCIDVNPSFILSSKQLLDSLNVMKLEAATDSISGACWHTYTINSRCTVELEAACKRSSRGPNSDPELELEVAMFSKGQLIKNW